MGCDIHMVLEKKYDGEWVGVHAFPAQLAIYSEEIKDLADANSVYLPAYVWWVVSRRNYDLFGQIAGVRRGGPDPRGIPSDASSLARMELDSWGDGAHSCTWLSLEEAVPMFAAHYSPEDMLGEERRWISSKLFDVGYDEVADHRLVIWFDN